MGSISCPETSASNYKSMLHNIPQQRRSQVVAVLSSLLLPGLANDRLPKLCQRYYVCGPHVDHTLLIVGLTATSELRKQRHLETK
jgi:hypothetical protein